MELFTPRSLIAGRLTGGQGRAVPSAMQAAAAVLGTAQVALLCATDKDQVWYLAAPASEFASHLQSACVLAAALPQNAEHKGDGAYVADMEGGLQAVVLKLGDKFQSYVGTPALVQRFAAMEGATAIHVCNGAGLPWTFPAQPRSDWSGRLVLGVTLSGLLVALLAAALWLWAAAQVTAFQQESEDLQLVQQAAMKNALQSLTPAVYPPAISNLQRAVEQCAQEGSTLVQFEHKEGHSIWQLLLNNQLVRRSGP